MNLAVCRFTQLSYDHHHETNRFPVSRCTNRMGFRREILDNHCSVALLFRALCGIATEMK